MSLKLLRQALLKVISGMVLVALLLFLPAGTLDWKRAWLFLFLLFVPMIAVGFYLMIQNPALLASRLNIKEQQQVQSRLIAWSGIQFVLAFLTAGLDFRFSWSQMPAWTVVVFGLVFLGSYCLYGRVLQENTWLSRTVEVQQGQKVIDTGLYGIVRHPMYLASILLFWSFPLVLGSLIAFLVMLPYPLLLVKRIANEEQVLKEGLEGYQAYMEKVKYRLIPGIW